MVESFLVRARAAFDRRIINKFISFRRKKYNEKKRKRLENLTPSILSNNCSGGIIYSDLGLKFNSPTVNLYLSFDNFISLVRNLEYYSKCSPVQVYQEGIEFPIGKLQRDDETVILYFMHYHSFEEARDKWLERGMRIDFDNIFIMIEYPGKLTSEMYQKFSGLPYKNKLIFTRKEHEEKDVVPLNIYDKDYFHGKLFAYPSRFSKKRYLDSFDYVSFLNQNVNSRK
ncbi:MAG: DUF1919 domain-containing protein [Lachnospiraceae bacterium]